MAIPEAGWHSFLPEIRVGFHCSRKKFNKFSLSYFGQSDAGQWGEGIYFSDKEEIASQWGNYLYRCNLHFYSPFIIESGDMDKLNDFLDLGTTTKECTDKLKELGYDSIISEGETWYVDGKTIEGNQYVIFDPENIDILDVTDLDEDKKMNEAFETHNKLNPRLFNNSTKKMRGEVRERLIEIADKFVDSLKEDGVPLKVYDYWVLGSNAAYNYTPKSDIDTHIIVNMEDVDVAPEVLTILYNYAKSKFNDDYDITIRGQEVELYIEDINTSAISNGVYSLKRDIWIKEPEPMEESSIDITDEDEYKEWELRFNNTIESGDIEKLQSFVDDIYILRKDSLAKDGEFGLGNLIFKEMRNQDKLQQIKDKIKELESKELTLESFNESADKKTPVGFMDVYLLPKFPDTGLIITAVSPEARGRGIATNLAQSTIDYFKEHGVVSKLRWLADADNETSKKLADSLGFKKVSENLDEVEFIYELEPSTEEPIKVGKELLDDVKSIISTLDSKDNDYIGNGYWIDSDHILYREVAYLDEDSDEVTYTSSGKEDGKANIAESIDTEDYYRFTIKNKHGRDMGSFSRVINKLLPPYYDETSPLYDIDYDMYTIELDTPIPPDDKITKDARFAYKKSFVDKHKEEFEDLETNLKEIGYGLITKKFKRPDNIIYEDDVQIAYIPDMKEKLSESIEKDSYKEVDADEIISGLIDNASDDDIDNALRYLSRAARLLGVKRYESLKVLVVDIYSTLNDIAGPRGKRDLAYNKLENITFVKDTTNKNYVYLYFRNEEERDKFLEIADTKEGWGDEATKLREKQERTVYNAWQAWPQYRQKYGRVDSFFELQHNFHLTNDEVKWILGRCLERGLIDDYTKDYVIDYLKLNESLSKPKKPSNNAIKYKNFSIDSLTLNENSSKSKTTKYFILNENGIMVGNKTREKIEEELGIKSNSIENCKKIIDRIIKSR